jgi:hypothetical protein
MITIEHTHPVNQKNASIHPPDGNHIKPFDLIFLQSLPAFGFRIARSNINFGDAPAEDVCLIT